MTIASLFFVPPPRVSCGHPVGLVCRSQTDVYAFVAALGVRHTYTASCLPRSRSHCAGWSVRGTATSMSGRLDSRLAAERDASACPQLSPARSHELSRLKYVPSRGYNITLGLPILFNSVYIRCSPHPASIHVGHTGPLP